MDQVLAFREPSVRAIASRTATKCGICEDASSEAELRHTCSSPDSKTFGGVDVLRFDSEAGWWMRKGVGGGRSQGAQHGPLGYFKVNPNLVKRIRQNTNVL